MKNNKKITEKEYNNAINKNLQIIGKKEKGELDDRGQEDGEARRDVFSNSVSIGDSGEKGGEQIEQSGLEVPCRDGNWDAQGGKNIEGVVSFFAKIRYQKGNKRRNQHGEDRR